MSEVTPEDEDPLFNPTEPRRQGGPPAEDVQPGRWSELAVLFDDGDYSVVVGIYRLDNGTSERSIGQRFNGHADGTRGYPTSYGAPVWYITRGFLEYATLHAILDELVRNPAAQQPERNVPPGTECQIRIERVLRELRVYVV